MEEEEEEKIQIIIPESKQEILHSANLTGTNLIWQKKDKENP